MGNKIKITESQLKMILGKKKLIENFDEDSDEFGSMKSAVSSYIDSGEDSIETPEALISSISDRLANAISSGDWEEVKSINHQVNSFKDKMGGGEESSVANDTPEEYDERNFGISESIEKIKSEFKRFL